MGAGERYRWTVTRSAAELDKLLASYKLGPIRGHRGARARHLGRARAVKITGATRAETIRGELRIRQTFGPAQLAVRGDGGQRRRHLPRRRLRHGWDVPDRQHRHGRGGRSYKEILKHYYQARAQEALVTPPPPPPVRGVGRSGGALAPKRSPAM
jgi:hypothetical protein